MRRRCALRLPPNWRRQWKPLRARRIRQAFAAQNGDSLPHHQPYGRLRRPGKTNALSPARSHRPRNRPSLSMRGGESSPLVPAASLNTPFDPAARHSARPWDPYSRGQIKRLLVGQTTWTLLCDNADDGTGQGSRTACGSRRSCSCGRLALLRTRPGTNCSWPSGY